MKLESERDQSAATRVATILRQEIVSGLYTVGQRLPTRVNLGQRYRASALTIKKAIDQLVAEGFLEAVARQGTFIAHRAPHLSKVGIVYPMAVETLRDSPFGMTLRDVAMSLQGEGEQEFNFYYGVDWFGSPHDIQRLIDDVKQHRLAGLLFTSPPHYLKQHADWGWFDMPMVSISSMPFQGMSVVGLDYASFYDEAIQAIKGMGKTKVAHILHPDAHVFDDYLVNACQSHGLIQKRLWTQYLTPIAIANCLQLLLGLSESERPDALVVGDDGLLEPTLVALAGLGLRIPDDLVVVSHANLPRQDTIGGVVQRIGFDAKEVLRVCLESLQGDAKRKEFKVMAKRA